MQTDCRTGDRPPSPASHLCDLPEVTFWLETLVGRLRLAQHANMRLKSLLLPLNIAAISTVAAIGATLSALPPVHWPLVYGLLLAFGVLMLLADLLPSAPRHVHHAALLAMGAIGLFLLLQFPRAGSLPILSVIWAAMIASSWPPRTVVAGLLANNLAAWWILQDAGYRSPLMSVVLFACFQLFAVLTVHYARSAERSRDALALVNADLLATRALLTDATRDAERLRMARELHDVAGHNLTALTLNLHALAADPALASRGELRTAQAAASRLMGDIRGVVHALRDARGLDVATALQALAAPLPRLRLHLDIAADVRIEHAAIAETLLRIVQEALTNAARHGNASTLHVRLQHKEDALQLQIHDDARAPRISAPLREGHGLTGMRERIGALDGTVDIARSAGGVRIKASLPYPGIRA